MIEEVGGMMPQQEYKSLGQCLKDDIDTRVWTHDMRAKVMLEKPDSSSSFETRFLKCLLPSLSPTKKQGLVMKMKEMLTRFFVVQKNIQQQRLGW